MTKVNTLANMGDQEFVDFAKKATSKRGIAGSKASLNIRGLKAAIGRTADGEFYFQTAKSEPATEIGEFTQRVIDAGVEREGHEARYARARAYDRMFAYLAHSDIAAAIPRDTVVTVELYSTDLPAKVQPGRERAARRGAAIGDWLTVFPFAVFRASTGEQLTERRRKTIFAKLYKANPEGDTTVRIVSPRMTIGRINLGNLESVADLDLSVLRTRNEADEKARRAVRRALDRAKNWAHDTILNAHQAAGKTRLGYGFGFLLETDSGTYALEPRR